MDSYVEYKSSLCSLKNLLGLGCIHILEKDELMPYISKIISGLNGKLILEGKDTTEENIKLFISYYENELDKILGDEEEMNDVISGYGFDPESEDFSLKHFLVSWTNIYSTIYLEEMYNYAYLFTDSAIDCHECCGTIGEDENGNTVYTPGTTNISSKYYCGCGNK